MEPTEKELEVRLRELGMRLASPPSDVDELLRILDQTEIYLSRVEQSPSPSMSDALRPAMNSLITKRFLNHTEEDVKIFVAACVNEIIRVTAPDAPYDDALMKEIFAIIVDAFKKLDDMAGCLYSKRVSILEIMAKVRSCVIMLDLECDGLILHMFKHFLKSIRPDHPINVFSSMETIMTLILEESEDISQELLICLLSNVQKSNKGIIPAARRLAEKVITNCSTKLKPYFLVAVQSTGTCLRDYSDIVSSICKNSSVAIEQNEVDNNKLSVRTVSDELPQESAKLDKPVSCLEDVGAAADQTIKVTISGAVPLGNGNAVIEPVSPELEPEISLSSEQCTNDVAPIGENNSLGSITEKPGNEPSFQSIEAKSSSVQLTDASDSSRVDGDKEATTPTRRRAGRKRQTKSLKSRRASDMAPETEVVLESEREAEIQPLEGLVGDNTCVNSSAPAYNSPGSGLSIRRRVADSQFDEKKSSPHKPAPSPGKKKMSGITVEKEGPLAIVSEHRDHCLVNISDGKPSQDSAKKSLADIAMAEVAASETSAGKSLREEQIEVASVVADANTFVQSNINQPEARDVTDKDASAEPCLKEMMVSSKASMEANNVQKWVKFAGESLVKKGRRKASRAYNKYLEIIGRGIEVLWPDDNKFYKGVIDAFDPATKKHRVVYDDGDVEILLLRNERWNYIDSKNFQRGQEDDIAIPEFSLPVPGKRRRGRPGRKAIRERKSGDGNSIQITSEVGTSLIEKTPESNTEVENKPSENPIIIKDNNISSKLISDRKFERKSNTIQKDYNPVDAGDKLHGKAKGRRRKLGLKSRGKSRGETSKNSRTLNENSEIIDSVEKLKGEDRAKVDDDLPRVRRRKRKATDTDSSAIKNLEGFSQKIEGKINKRRKEKIWR